VTGPSWAVPGDAAALVAACERLAESSLERQVYDFIAGGADDESALRANTADYRGYAVRPRALAGQADVELAVSVLGARWTAPLFVAPMGGHRLVHEDGELASAAAARQAGIGYVTSSAATTRLEDVASAAGPGAWFQLYCLRDRAVTADLVRRAEAAGYGAICVTGDMPVVGLRQRDLVNRYAMPAGMGHANLDGYRFEDAAPGQVSYFGRLIDGSLGWHDLDWLRSVTTLPLVVKGVMTADDARRAVSAGVDAAYVSNHGGRQLGYAPSTVAVLTEIVEAVGGRIPVLVDGGVRGAVDALIALCLGATAVGIGRPVLWALAAGGEAGVSELLDRFSADLSRLTALAGRAGIADLSPEVLAPSRPA
jgi:isopentenyl diphosphate isomerase/L-lactate dehydrogenase-like FMN-dependent dehydrogenase